QPWGTNCFGEAVELYTLTNARGVEICIMTHGATIVSLHTPDRSGHLADIVLGHDTAAEYTLKTPYFGCATGRFANRIKHGKFILNGKPYTLAINNGPNSLHGGVRGFDKVIWSATSLPDQNAVRMTYVSADGEEGFPGEVRTEITYTLTQTNDLQIDYQAESTRPTPYNITNHSYFNLVDHDAGDHGNQLVTIYADTFIPTDATAIPYGYQQSVEGTPFDFRTPHAIGERIKQDDEQLHFGNGYDHTFCLNKPSDACVSLAARAEDPVSGRMMEVYTTEPGVQFYAGNYLNGTIQGKNGCCYVRRGGFCFETQHYPDSPNQLQFPSTLLSPDAPFRSQTVYRFSAG
ncbi:MAG: galactose mutarotase, partial [Kiritimatiellaceae bacterium]|nr:galactose mutarotase [Kiritimatiellaceae bacterium]